MKNKVVAFCEKHSLLSTGDRVIVGVSGGADSVCLLLLLLELSREMNFHLEAVHIHHGLRKEADEEKAYVIDLCKERDIPLHIFDEDIKKAAKESKKSIEETGRIVRRSCFEKICRECEGTKIALGQHQNDNVETFFLNLSRGTGLKGMGGILPIKGKWIRPLLCVSREEIEDYLKENQIIYFDDASNKSDEYTRNRIRNRMIPFLEEQINAKAVPHINFAIEQLQEINQYLAKKVESHFREVSVVDGEKETILFLEEPYKELEELFKGMVIQKGLGALAGKEKDLTTKHIEAMKALFKKQVSKSINLPYKMKATRVYEGVLIEKPSHIKKMQFCLSLEELPHEIEGKRIEKRIICDIDATKKEENSTTQLFNYDIMKDDIFIRTRLQGDYIVIDKALHRQKLKDYFINQKIKQSLRDEILLVCKGSRVLWVMGYRVDNAYVAKQDTRNILEIRVTEIEKREREGCEHVREY